MTLKQIIIVDEDGTKYTVRSSDEPYQDERMEEGKIHIQAGVNEPLPSFLIRFAREEWRKVRRLGARLAGRN